MMMLVMEPMDPVFKALADPHRRQLLDRLHERDGQTLTELQGYLPMSRFGCMKHLKLLEEVGLITTRKAGREKFHYLNPVPIQQVYERWVGKYARPWARTLTRLKESLEGERMNQPPSHIYQIFIQTTPERLWHALTDGELTRRYYFGSAVESDWQPGSSYRFPNPAGGTFVEGEVLEVDPPRRLVTTFHPTFGPAADGAPVTTVTWEIEPVGSACRLTLVHEGLALDDPMREGITTGWAQILSGLKTVLETGEPLVLGTAEGGER